MVTPGNRLGRSPAPRRVRQDGRRLHSVIDVRNRRDYRALLLTTPGLDEWVSGIILSTETLGQQLSDGTAFAAPLGRAVSGGGHRRDRRARSADGRRSSDRDVRDGHH